MALQMTQPVRPVPYGDVVRDQFALFGLDGYTKQTGLAGSITTTVWRDGAVVGTPPTITLAEVGTSGEYAWSFTPNQTGVWMVEFRVALLTFTWTGQYDVRNAVLPGQSFYDTVRDQHGNGVPYVLVEVLLSGTATVVTSTSTAFDGSYSIPLTGALLANPLVDLRFSGGLITTVVKSAVRLA